MYALFKKEFFSFFSNATGYIVIGLFLVAQGLFLWVIPGNYNIIENGYAELNGLFTLAPWLFMFLCPAVSMRTLAEERQNRTWDLLIVQPISKRNIVLSKYLACWALVVAALLPCLVGFLSVYFLAEPIGNIDQGAFWGAFMGLLFLSGVNCAIGIYASSLTKSQIVAFIIALLGCFLLLYGFDLLSSLFKNGKTIHIIQSFGFLKHYQSISRGVIDSRDILYFVSTATLFLALTIKHISKR